MARSARIEASVESEREGKIIKETSATTTAKDGIYDSLLNKHDLPKLLRVSTWIRRFLNNCKKRKTRGLLLRNEEIEKQLKFYIKREQAKVTRITKFNKDKKKVKYKYDPTRDI